ncbi:hemin ABC transporter substrate-binding protein [Vibrio parahaemolyticus]|uniref:heme/hemin ABC transporter substrate-binding protein n=1 Tax=Vibrio parahaemolyticus TaxID=670 RepID=UPI0004179514|nr:hemin ABC transporter substrate-binding protein [Vibrio parahaemolyticus]ELB2120249.1 hemin ABC transporter substrate-binding protein [Vibrio parahaemolyticus]MBE4062704.1 hemin ABC transporter substrate-binding protein [Vibrio parahaemolyticus]MBE4485671.1 hemin ABC transporter substrate-binding protein [Vibrio parahaemolyticus]MBE4490249.1 hemin ABC transporter substrate-binding protein [Vibrio parahaemolyticus]MBE4500277.1 hemin ABC transporter substrate-binding protein [Vibrio parahaemo
MKNTLSPVRTALTAAALLLASTNLFADNAPNSERVVSAGSAVTELLLALDAKDSLVAVDVTSTLPQGMELPDVGYHRRLSAEGLLALSPTKLIGSDEMGPTTTLNQLKSAGVDVEIVNTEANVDGLLHRIDQIAIIMNRESQAANLKQEVKTQVESLQANQPAPSAKKKVLFLLIHEGRPANVAGLDTTPNAIIALAGGDNPAAKKLTSYKPLSTEAMVEMQPDVILVSGRSYETMGGADAILKAMPLLAATPAGQTKNIITIDGHALVGGLGLKSLSEAKRLNTLLYP